ncbi:MAG TPA: FtsX-like permease family protein [Xanthobacteraceae bacterium]
MSGALAVAGGRLRGSALAWRLALRELRAGLRGFYVFIACIALGVAAIAGVGSLARSLADGLAREGRVILGGDAVFSLIHREADRREQAFLEDRGRVSTAATMRAMARTDDGRAALVEIKAVDDRYPLYGAVRFSPPRPAAELFAAREGIFGAAADPALLARLDLVPGSRIRVGESTIEIRASLEAEPDKLATRFALGPRLLMSQAGLLATGLVQPGSLVRWNYRLRLPDNDAGDRATEAAVNAARAAFPDAGWEIRTRDNASPELGRNIARFTQFLTLVGLTSLLVGGVGVANAVKSYLDRKRDVIATLKALGATGREIFSIYLGQVLLLALLGIALGLAAGAAIPFLLATALGAVIPVPIAAALYPGQLAVALLYGVLTALAFALWPLGRAHDVPVSALFRDEVAPQRRFPRARYIFGAAATVAVLAAAAIALAYDRRLAAIFVASAAAVFIALRSIALALMAIARRAPRPRSSLFRLILADLHRPGAVTPVVVLSLGLGLALMVTLTLIDGNLRRQFTAGLPERAPSFYFLDVQASDAARFDTFIAQHAPGAKLERVPMLRGRIVSAHGVAAENLRPPPSAAWVLHSDRGITFAREVPPGSRIVAGQWWKDGYDGPPLVSVENKIAEGLGLKLGDPVVVNVLGRNITATVANLRSVDWETLGINFVLVFSPGSFRGAPHADIATLTYPEGGTSEQEIGLLKAAAEEFPTVTLVRVKEVLQAIAKLVLDLTMAIRGASGLTLISAVLVLAGALATGHRHRVYDAVVLRMLGASRGRLLGFYALEYLLLGLATALFGLAAGSIAAFLVVTEVMEVAFVWLAGPAILVALAALALTVVFGLVGTFTALSHKPGPVLRNL